MSIGNSILFVAVVLIGLVLTWHQARSGRQVAAQVLESNAAVAAQAAETAKANTKALNGIHRLVNSNLTQAQQETLNATRRDLASLQELADYKEKQGMTVSSEAKEVIRLAKIRVTQLSSDLEQKEAVEADVEHQTEE